MNDQNIGLRIVRGTVMFSILLFGMCLLSSCAHKSGRRNDDSNKRQRVEHIEKRETNDGVPQVPDPPKGGSVLSGTEIFERYNAAVFMVFTSDGVNGYQGSGFFINDKGLAVSNYHVFQGTAIGQEQIKLATDNEHAYKVKNVIARSQEPDFIIFEVDCSTNRYIPIAASKPKVGEKVYAIGSPRGLENTFSSGEVSQWRADNLMQISALIDHGSSGGALINERGEVVGITSGSFADGSQANLNYAWSIDAVKPHLK